MKLFHGVSLAFASLCSGVFFFPVQAAALPADNPVDNLIDLDIEALMNVEVYSVSKKLQHLKDVSSAVFVINREMIQKSGLTEIPEILRLAPGVQVARINGDTWSVSIRGGSGRYGDKLLVMIDGRSIYTPLYAGVYWENQDLLPDDIERIEVIRGPGASVWGANAVNGVINIITRNAADTQGFHADLSSGTINRALAGIRYGGALNEDAHYRFSFKFRDQTQLDRPDGSENYDGMQFGGGSFRTDWIPNGKDRFSFQGSVFDGSIDENMVETFAVPPYVHQLHEDDDSNGWDLLGTWERELSAGNSIDARVYYDSSYRDTYFYVSDLDIWNVELQHQLEIGDVNNLIYGFRYRNIQSDFEGRENLLIRQQERSEYLYSFFIQDEIELYRNSLFLTVGSKFEEQSLSDFEILPTLRLLWKLNEKNSFWGAVSRSSRSPSIAEQDATIEAVFQPMKSDPSQLIGLHIVGNPDLEAEESVAWEAGFRSMLSDNAGIDIALFYNEYEKVRGYEYLPPVMVSGPNPYLLTSLRMVNNLSGYTYGFEVSGDWKPLDNLSMHASYSNLQIKLDRRAGQPDFLLSEFKGRSPSSLYTVNLNWSPRKDIDLGAFFYGVSALDYGEEGIPAYLRCDLRLAWRPTTGVELSLTGQNLLDSEHLEYPSTDALFNSEIPCSVYARVTLDL